jgi:hypothetical protein
MPRFRLHNPPGGIAARRSPRRHNTKRRRVIRVRNGGVLSYMALNPKRKHRSRNRKHRVVRHRRANPVMNLRRRKSGGRKRRHNVVKVYNRHHRRRSNPMLSNLTQTLKRAGWAIGGGVLTRSIPQAVLGDKNTGLMGYGANLLTAAVGAGAVGKFMGPDAAESFLLGGFVMIAGRVVEDYFGRKVVEFASVGLPLPQLGAGDPAYDLRMMGDFINQQFPVPYSSLPSGRYLPPAPTPEAAAIASTSKAAMGLGLDRTWSMPWN